MIWAWAVVMAGDLQPRMYFYEDSADRAMDYAREVVRKDRKACHVVKLVETHFVSPPVCTCQPTTTEVSNADAR